MKKKTNINYVMYGYCMSDKDNTKYLKYIPSTKNEEKEYLTDDVLLAMKFPSKNIHRKKGFGTPEQWLNFINDELKDIFGKNAFKFHLVETTLK